jgi:hypothetical protein
VQPFWLLVCRLFRIQRYGKCTLKAPKALRCQATRPLRPAPVSANLSAPLERSGSRRRTHQRFNLSLLRLSFGPRSPIRRRARSPHSATLRESAPGGTGEQAGAGGGHAADIRSEGNAKLVPANHAAGQGGTNTRCGDDKLVIKRATNYLDFPSRRPIAKSAFRADIQRVETQLHAIGGSLEAGEYYGQAKHIIDHADYPRGGHATIADDQPKFLRDARRNGC